MAYRRAVTLIALVAIYALLWRAYAHSAWMTASLPKHLGNVLPLFVKSVPAALDDAGVKIRLAVALAVAMSSIVAVCLAATRAPRAIVCLLVAIPAVFATNATVARIRGGRASFVEPYSRPTLEYFHDVKLVRDHPIEFARDYAAIHPQLSHHAATHPPGGVLFLWLGAKFFGPSIDAAAWWSVGFGALGVLPSYWLATTLGGAAAARRLMPLYLVTPNLVLFGATSMDAVFLVFLMASIATGIHALHHRKPLRIAIAGAALWLAAFMNFTAVAVPVLLITYALCIIVRRHDSGLRMLVATVWIGLVSIVIQLIARFAAGYDFIAVARAAMQKDYAGLKITGYESFQVWWQISLGNLVAFCVATGLAALALFTMALAVSFAQRRWNGRGLVVFAPAVAVCLIVIACSTLFTLETERVWVFLAPLVLVAGTAQLKGRPGWIIVIAAQAIQTVATELLVNTRW